MQESYCFFHSSRPHFLAATRFYYPGRGSSQFSLASHNSPAELLLGKHRRDTQRARHELVASQRELPLILRVWQSAGGVSSSLCRFLECHYRSRMGLLETIRPSPRWRRIVDEKKRRILTIRVINYQTHSNTFWFHSYLPFSLRQRSKGSYASIIWCYAGRTLWETSFNFVTG